MKKNLLIIAAAISLASCSNDESEFVQIPQEVNVSLDYSFVESGAMTRAGNSVYTDFYEKYIKTKVLTPKTFSLTFKNKETGATATINGDWVKNHSLKLLTGVYEVTGTSHPASSKCLDSLYLCFNEEVSINNDTENINLTAQYDSYLLMFDKSDKTAIDYRYKPTINTYQTIGLSIMDDIYYAFFNEFIGYTPGNSIVIKRNNFSSSINMDNIPFEKGKYYYFNDLSNSFDIPPMEEGN